jgi:hypothetical protein
MTKQDRLIWIVGLVACLALGMMLGHDFGKMRSVPAAPSASVVAAPSTSVSGLADEWMKAVEFCEDKPADLRRHGSDCWAELVHAGVVCIHYTRRCPQDPHPEITRPPTKCEAPCDALLAALTDHYDAVP